MTQKVTGIYQMRSNRLHNFKPKIEINAEVGSFQIKTVTNLEDLKEALELRYEVFHKEMMGKKNNYGIDVDEFDFDCDHLIIKDLTTNKIIGTYRIRSTQFSDHFYSEKEFMMSSILQKPGAKLELGRACIHKDYRRGVIISLLWKGIADYISASNSDFLFGCATVTTDDPRKAALLTKYFEEDGRINPEFRARPTLKYTMPLIGMFKQEFENPLTPEQKAEAKALIPPLCRAYLKIGAYIAGEPAWDKEFQCIDFLTILRREDLNESVSRRYRMS
jgi:putative hemolysin